MSMFIEPPKCRGLFDFRKSDDDWPVGDEGGSLDPVLLRVLLLGHRVL